MGFVSDLESTSPSDLLSENLESLLQFLKDILQAQDAKNGHIWMEVGPQVCQRLSVPKTAWNWLDPAVYDSKTALLVEIAVICFNSCPDQELLFLLLQVISLYCNEHVPWSNAQLARVALTVAKSKCGPFVPRFASWIISCFLPVAAPRLTTVSLKRQGRSRFSKAKAPRPALGLQISSMTEDTQRAEWKSSPSVTSLASVLLLMKLDNNSDYCAKCASFVLNVLDDSDPLFRAQGCFLLQDMILLGHGGYLLRAGLIGVFEESVKTCLTYLPQLTPAVVSIRLLKDAAYPVLLAILGLCKDTTYRSYLEVLDSHVLASISHVSGRNNDRPTNCLLAIFFRQIYSLISQHLKLSVLACFTRLNFVLCQTITSPFLIESDGGDEVVAAALGVQRLVLDLCVAREDPDAARLFLLYKLDFLAAWAILGKRMAKFGVGNDEISLVLKENFLLLKRVANVVGSGQNEADVAAEVEADIEAVFSKAPELKSMWT